MRVTSSNENMSWIVLMLILLSINVDVLRSKEIDEDDDIDPFDDDDEPINYPIKSVMPERALTQNGPKILPDDGSGQPSQKVVLDYQMEGRLENLEKYIALLTTKLQQQEQRNGELVAAIEQQQQQRNNEKLAFVKAVGVLQGAVAQLAGRVDVIPKMFQKERKNQYKQNLASSIDSMSKKMGELGERLSKTGEIHVRDTRSQTAGELLSKLLGKDIEKALKEIPSSDNKNKNGEAKDVSSMTLGTDSVAPAVVGPSVIATNSQPIVPIDLLPQSHMTSLSTPTGQGPAGSASSNPILQNVPSVQQVPLQASIPAKSTPTGSGPVGSVSTMPITDQTVNPLATVSLTSVASKFKPPVGIAGYNVLPLAPLPQIQTQALEPPGIMNTQPDIAPLVNADQTVPNAINPYEILTSAQMQPRVVQPVGFNAPLPVTSQVGNPYEMLTTEQVRPFGYPVTKRKVNKENSLGKKGKVKKIKENEKVEERKESEVKYKKGEANRKVRKNFTKKVYKKMKKEGQKETLN